MFSNFQNSGFEQKISSGYFNNCVFQIPAIVPGGIYSDLLNSGILTSDIYYRFNEDNYKWVAETNWTYTTIFKIPQETLTKNTIYLNCEGIV